jgi:hypothetical protein
MQRCPKNVDARHKAGQYFTLFFVRALMLRAAIESDLSNKNGFHG